MLFEFEEYQVIRVQNGQATLSVYRKDALEAMLNSGELKAADAINSINPVTAGYYIIKGEIVLPQAKRIPGQYFVD